MKINYQHKRQSLFPQYQLKDLTVKASPVAEAGVQSTPSPKGKPVSMTIWRYGTGFRVSPLNLQDYNISSKQTLLNFQVGKSHPILYEVPSGVSVEINKTGTSRTLSSKEGNLLEVGRVKAEMRKRCPFNRNSQSGIQDSEKPPGKKAIKGAKTGAKK